MTAGLHAYGGAAAGMRGAAAHQDGALPAAPQHVDEDLVREDVQLLLVLPLHVGRAGQAQDPRKARLQGGVRTLLLLPRACLHLCSAGKQSLWRLPS